ncbi:MAG: hypothetical protein ACLQGP_18395 [Isosphaeraceae bacterium]
MTFNQVDRSQPPAGDAIDPENPTMIDQQPPQWVVPNPQIPRTFGLLNIIFGVILLLVGVGTAVSYALGPTFMRLFQEQMAKQQADLKAKRDAQIADLKNQEDAAKTKEEKEALKARRDVVEAMPQPNIPDLTEMSGMNVMSDRRLAIYYFSEIGAAILLNILMIIAGAGLIALKEWGRRMSLWVAWLKILRWAAMVVMAFVLVLPITMEKMTRTFEKLLDQSRPAGAAPPIKASELARYSAISGGILVVLVAIGGSIYPALSLWFLTRPRARAACLPAATKPETSEEPTPWS